MRKVNPRRTAGVLFPAGVAVVALSSAAWACTLGVGPTDGLYPMDLTPPAAARGTTGQASVTATAVFDGIPVLTGSMPVYQDDGLSGAMGMGNTIRASLPDACTTGDPQVGTLTWANNVGTGNLTLQAGSNGSAFVPGVYEVCAFHLALKPNRFLAYFTFV